MRRSRISRLLPGFLLLVLVFPSVAYAQPDDPGLRINTDYPSLVIGIDETVTLDLTLQTGSVAQVVELEVRGLPESWAASFRGRGHTVRSVYLEPGEKASVDLRLEPPVDIEAGTYRFDIIARGSEAQAVLPIELIVQEKAPASLAFDIELPTLRGKPNTTFRYNVTLRNEGDEDLAVDLFAQAPPVFRVTFKSGGQEVTNIPLSANSSKRLSVEADPLLNVIPADRYPIVLRAQGAEASASADLIAEVVGQSSLTMTTPDGRLSGKAEAGGEASYTLLIRNSGSAVARGIKLRASPPSGWSVEFDPPEIQDIQPAQQVEVIARVRPAEKALAGDYMVTFRAQPENEATESIDFRVTVRTSTLWGIVGVGLIAVSVAVVGWAVMRFGRR